VADSSYLRGASCWGLGVLPFSVAFDLALARQGWPVIRQLGTTCPFGAGLIKEWETMNNVREIVGLTEPLISGAEYWVQWSRQSIDGEYVTVEHVNRKGVATVKVKGNAPISAGRRFDVRVADYVWYTDLI